MRSPLPRMSIACSTSTCAESTTIAVSGTSSRITRAASSPSVVWLGGIRRQVSVAERLADEQAALRRIATLVARGVPPAELFAAVADETARLLPADSAFIGHLEPDSSFVVLAIGG